MSHLPINRVRGGFTLLEVLIAIGLVMALLGSMFTFMFDLLSSRDRALQYSAKQLAATTLIERVEADLVTCVVGDADSGSGIEGDTQRLRILTRSVAASLAERGVGDPAVFGDLQVTEYKFNESRRQIMASRRSVQTNTTDRTSDFPVGGSVYKVRFRFHDGTSWRDTFDSRSYGRLPLAVEVAVWFEPWLGEEPDPIPPEDEPDRLTFDAADTFDERAFAEQSDLEFYREPRPDRIRVIVIPDASTGDDATGGVEMSGDDDFVTSAAPSGARS
ncbi:MAG: prepilin-type N-terminal cleavage/methylation domain-containing protein [Phycisphaerales bacterium]